MQLNKIIGTLTVLSVLVFGCDNRSDNGGRNNSSANDEHPAAVPTQNLTPEPTEEPTPIPKPLVNEKSVIIVVNSSLTIEVNYYKWDDGAKSYSTVECKECQENGEEKELDWIVHYESNGVVEINPRFLGSIRILNSIKSKVQ